MVRLPTLLPAGLLLVAAAGLYGARALAWGGAVAPDGTRYKVSPVGLSHVLAPDQPVSPTRDCRWSAARTRGLPRCSVAPGGETAFRALRLVSPLLQVAVLFCFIAAIMLVRPRATAGLRSVFPTAAVIAALSALALFAVSAPRALAALQGLAFGVGGTRGTLQVAVAAAVLAGFAGAYRLGPLARPRPSGDRIRLLPSAVLLLLPVSAFLAMFPPLGGLAFATVGSGVGLATGWWARGYARPVGGPTAI